MPGGSALSGKFASIMIRALVAGASYFAIVFACGFALGSIRVLVVAPRIGELAAVLTELPIMVAASWFVCVRVVRRVQLSGSLGPRLVMGVLAFALLMAAEAILSIYGFGRSLSDFMAGLASRPGLIGLAGQVAFGVFPAIVSRGGH
jgi:hypothetical protein